MCAALWKINALTFQLSMFFFILSDITSVAPQLPTDVMFCYLSTILVKFNLIYACQFYNVYTHGCLLADKAHKDKTSMLSTFKNAFV